jgi:Tfp pilus assembly protein PilX
MRRPLGRQRGQALLIVLAFVAAFLLIVWAALSLASAAFLGVNNVRADTRTTYALDAGVAYGMQEIDDKNGNGCNAPPNSSTTLNYPSGNITVSVRITKGNPCHGNGATWNISVSASGTSRTLNAFETEVNGVGTITWEAFQ